MRRLNVSTTPLPGLMVIGRSPVMDERGFFERVFCEDELNAENVPFYIVQSNRTLTVRKGAVRGLHFQNPPHGDAKMVTCIAGRIFDVAVDLRRGSPTFLRWHGEELSADNGKSMLIPSGFAHGLQTLEENCQVLYFHDAPYVRDAERGLHPLDPQLDILWPLPILEMSQRDRGHQMLAAGFEGLPL